MVKHLRKRHYEKIYFNSVGGDRFHRPSPPMDPPLMEMLVWYVWLLPCFYPNLCPSALRVTIMVILLKFVLSSSSYMSFFSVLCLWRLKTVFLSSGCIVAPGASVKINECS